MEGDILEALNNKELRAKCVQYGLPNVPVTATSRKVLIRRLRRAIDSPTLKPKMNASPSSINDSIEALSNNQLHAKCKQYGVANIPITDSNRRILMRKLQAAMEQADSAIMKDNVNRFECGDIDETVRHPSTAIGDKAADGTSISPTSGRKIYGTHNKSVSWNQPKQETYPKTIIHEIRRMTAGEERNNRSTGNARNLSSNMFQGANTANNSFGLVKAHVYHVPGDNVKTKNNIGIDYEKYDESSFEVRKHNTNRNSYLGASPRQPLSHKANTTPWRLLTPRTPPPTPLSRSKIFTTSYNRDQSFLRDQESAENISFSGNYKIFQKTNHNKFPQHTQNMKLRPRPMLSKSEILTTSYQQEMLPLHKLDKTDDSAFEDSTDEIECSRFEKPLSLNGSVRGGRTKADLSYSYSPKTPPMSRYSGFNVEPNPTVVSSEPRYSAFNSKERRQQPTLTSMSRSGKYQRREHTASPMARSSPPISPIQQQRHSYAQQLSDYNGESDELAIEEDENAGAAMELSSDEYEETPHLKQFQKNLNRLKVDPEFAIKTGAGRRAFSEHSMLRHRRGEAISLANARAETPVLDVSDDVTFGDFMGSLERKYHLKHTFMMIAIFVLAVFVYVFILQ